MALAQQRSLLPQVSELPIKQVNPAKGQGLARAIALPRRIGWHLQAYVPILGIMLLVLGSLIFLQLHWLSEKFFRGWGKAEFASNHSILP